MGGGAQDGAWSRLAKLYVGILPAEENTVYTYSWASEDDKYTGIGSKKEGVKMEVSRVILQYV